MERKGFLINKAFSKYLLASVLTVAAAQIANIVDASLVGNIIGSDGLAAVIIVDPVVQIGTRKIDEISLRIMKKHRKFVCMKNNS